VVLAHSPRSRRVEPKPNPAERFVWNQRDMSTVAPLGRLVQRASVTTERPTATLSSPPRGPNISARGFQPRNVNLVEVNDRASNHPPKTTKMNTSIARRQPSPR